MQEPMDRRKFISALVAVTALHAGETEVQTATGPVPVSKLGTTLIHEHVMVDFIGAAEVSRSRYDANEVFRVALPKLKEVAARGCKTIGECTPAYLARDPALLQRLAKASGLHILTNTGYYGAANDKFVPKHAYTESLTQISERWIREATQGIEDTGVKPAFMKIGVDSGPLSEIDAKLINAGALCHKATGLRLHVHTGNGVAARAINDLLTTVKVDPSAYVWVHAQSEKDLSVHQDLASQGVWIELDGINAKSAEIHLRAVEALASKGHLSRMLLSQDSGWYRVGEPGGGQYNGYTYLFTDFVPALRQRGFTDAQIQTLLVANPARALTPLKPGTPSR
jgi:predicted metal-dependent phosphotriesterase family hydrolase